VHRWDLAARTHRRWPGQHFDAVLDLLDVLSAAPPLYLRTDAAGASGAERTEVAALRAAVRQRFPHFPCALKEVSAAGESEFEARVQQLLQGRVEDGTAASATDTWVDVAVGARSPPLLHALIVTCRRSV